MFSFDKKLEYACVLIIIAAVFDVMDGFMARKLNAKSEIGKNLDSFADVISFGLAPAIIIFHLTKLYYVKSGWFSSLMKPGFSDYLMLGSGFILVIFAAIRLAKFNIEKSSKYFTGLPTPAMALFVISLPVIVFHYEKTTLATLILNQYTIITTTLILSFLMISKIKFIGFKEFNHNKKTRILLYIFYILSFGIILFFLIFESKNLFQTENILKSQLDFFVSFIKTCIPGIPLIIFLYIIISIINQLFKIKNDEIYS
ncbi:MAG: hypothetical protein Kow0068_07060 [Marinilabiliales bacterium]